MVEKLHPTPVRTSDIDNIRELLEMLMSEHMPNQNQIKMRSSLGWEPPMDVFETDTEFVVIMDIAGMSLDQIGVHTDGRVLRILGERVDSRPAGRKQFHSLEIQQGPFQRLIGIPVAVEPDSIAKSYANGFLEIRLKRRLDSKRRNIDVE